MHPSATPTPASETPQPAGRNSPAPADPDAVLIGLDADLPQGLKAPGGYALRTLAIFLSIVAGIVVWMLGARYLPLPNLWSYSLVVLPIALVTWLVYLWFDSRRLIRQVGDPPKKLILGSGRESGREGRLLVAGKLARLAPFVKLGPVRDEAFEPIVFFAPRIIELPRAGTAVMVITTIAVAGLIEVLRTSTSLPLMRPGWLTVMAGIAVGAAVQMLIWPTYLRIAPGRLDVMRFTLGQKRPVVTTVNLRSAQVLAHFKSSTICILPQPSQGSASTAPAQAEPAPPPVTNATLPPPQWTTLNLRGVWKPAEVVHAVMRGAASTAPTPPLPDDQLLG